MRISAGTNPDGTRHRIERVIPKPASRRDADRELTRMLSDLDGGSLAEGRQSLAQYLSAEWLPSVTSVSKRGVPLAPTTRDKYAGGIRHIAPVIGQTPLQDLRVRDVARLRDTLLAAGELQPQTVSDIMRILGQALGHAEALGYVGKNVADARLVNRPVGRAPAFRTVDVDLGETILEAVRGTDPWDAAVALGLGLGMRRSEVLALRWDDLDETSVHISRALTYAEGADHFGPPKSKAGERDLPMPDFVARTLRRHKAAQAERLLRLGITPTFVIDNGAGQHRRPPVFSRAWGRFAEAHGFGDVTFHTLRHGFATLMLAGGVSDTVTIRLTGHADTHILRRYQNVVDDLKQDAARTMDRLLGQEGGTR